MLNEEAKKEIKDLERRRGRGGLPANCGKDRSNSNEVEAQAMGTEPGQPLALDQRQMLDL